MKLHWMVVLSLMAALIPGHALAKGGARASAGPPLKTEEEKVSYSIGLNVGRNLKQQGIEINSQAFARGVKDAQSGNPPVLSDEEIRQVMTAFQMKMRIRQQKEKEMQGEKNKKEGTAFLARNKGEKGVRTTASGLQYKVIREGKGKSPQKSDRIRAHYRGTLLDGTEFDSSYARGKPAEFPVGGVIPGWQEALQMMKVGGKWMVYIPSDLAYGERGAGRQIGPHATLIFEIELIEIK